MKDIELKLFEYAINHSEEEVLQKFLDEAEAKIFQIAELKQKHNFRRYNFPDGNV